MDRSRKTWVVFALAALVALAMALPAFASVGGSGYMTWDSMGGANGTSPHGGYTTTTNKCAVCHSVHNAFAMGQVLLRSDVVDACEYCHVGGDGGYTQVYSGDINNYSGTDYKNAHNSYTVGASNPGVTCTKCHQVHGADNAMTSNPYLTSKILVGGKSTETAKYDPFAYPPLSTDSSDTALTKWCTACHDTSLGVGYNYYNGADWSSGMADESGVPNIGSTHVMTDDIATYTFPDGTTGQVAWAGSSQCSSCHSSGYGTSAWPHFTPGQRFLVTAASNASATPAPATDSSEDGVCLRCHRDGAGAGVGISW
jgi:hypothetical protein